MFTRRTIVFLNAYKTIHVFGRYDIQAQCDGSMPRRLEKTYEIE